MDNSSPTVSLGWAPSFIMTKSADGPDWDVTKIPLITRWEDNGFTAVLSHFDESLYKWCLNNFCKLYTCSGCYSVTFPNEETKTLFILKFTKQKQHILHDTLR